MGFTVFVNIGIIILSTFGFISTTYGNKLSELPDQFDNPVMAIGFGLTGLVTTLLVLGCEHSYPAQYLVTAGAVRCLFPGWWATLLNITVHQCAPARSGREEFAR